MDWQGILLLTPPDTAATTNIINITNTANHKGNIRKKNKSFFSDIFQKVGIRVKPNSKKFRYFLLR